jgi:hypothetical protein
MPVVWRLHADGTADYGGGAANTGKWAITRREGDKCFVRCEVGGTMTEQTLVLEGPDRFKLVAEVDSEGRPRMKPEELPDGGLTFSRANE